MIRRTLSPAVRAAAVAGMFYPADFQKLKSEIGKLLDDAHPSISEGRLIGLIVPHAGYMYSGLTAAHGYSLLSGKKFDSVVVISPSHREYFEGVSIYNGNAYQTPLGTLPVDEELRDQMVKDETVIIADEIGHRSEHAVEVHLPFLQYLDCTRKFLPVVMGDQRIELCQLLAKKLASSIKGKNVLVIASSDLSHYHPYKDANRLDQIIRNDISTFNTDRLTEDLDRNRAEMCGGGPVIAMLMATRMLGATKSIVLHQCNSGDITGEHDAVVGYLSAAIYSQI